jgi:TolA-binding protein
MFRKVLFLLTFLFSMNVIAQYNSERVFAFLEDTYNRHDKYLYDVLVVELEHYLKILPKSPNAARVQQMLGNVYNEKRKNDEAIACFLKMFCVYPDVANVAGNTDELRQLIANDKSYADKRDWLMGLLDQGVPNRSVQDSYFSYLGILMELNQSGLREWTIKECRDYILIYPDDARNEQVLRWMADTYVAKKDYREGVVIYSKYSFLYPNKPNEPSVLFKKAQVTYENLHDEAQALTILNGVINDYPNDAVIPDALFLRGVISEKESKNYKDAIADYRQLVDNHADNPKVIDALERTADIDEKNLKDYRATIDVLNEIVEKTKDDSKGIDALEHIGTLYERQLSDYTAAAATYARIADKYPNYEKAPDRLIDAGQLCEGKLDDYQKAISYYQMVVDKFPGNKKAEDARKRIEKAQEKLYKN